MVVGVGCPARQVSIYMFKTIAADGLAMQGARTSAVMALTQICRNIPDWAPEGLIWFLNKQNTVITKKRYL